MALRNAFADLGLDDTLKDILRHLQIVASRLGQNDGTGRMYINTLGQTLAATQSGTWTVAQGTAGAVTAPWPVNIQTNNGLDLHYQSQSAYDTIRTKITVA